MIPEQQHAEEPLSPDRQLLLRRMLDQRTRQRSGGAGPPRLSLFFFSANQDERIEAKHELVLASAELADRLGLHAVWVPERHFDPFGAPYPSPAVLLAAIAARTNRIGLRAGSVVLPLRDPLLVAEEWGVLASLSHGRIGLSLASGWHADDFVLNPDGYDDRKSVLERRLGELVQLWSGEALTRTGPGGRAVEVRIYPRPPTMPPVWLTSTSNPRTWEQAGRLGVNVLTGLLEQTLDDIEEKVARYHAVRREAGHPAAGAQVTCMLHTHLAPEAALVIDRVRGPLTEYLSAHLELFTKFAANQDVGVRVEDLRTGDRAALIEHGLRRYVEQAGLFGDVSSCLPMIDRLTAAGVTELACLVDFGLPVDQVLSCVEQLGLLNQVLTDSAAAR